MKTKLLLIAVACLLLGLTISAVAQNDTEPNFWFLEQGTEPTAENRINAIKNVGRGLLDFAIYQPTGSTFSEEYRQKLIDAGFVFDFVTAIQLPDDRGFRFDPPVGRTPVLVVPESVTLPTEVIERLLWLPLAFLGNAPELPESMNHRFITFINRKNAVEAERQRMREGLAALPHNANKTAEEIEAALQQSMPSPKMWWPLGMEQIGDDLAEALKLGWGTGIFPENFVAETGVKLLARRGIGVPADVFYVFANTKEDTKPIDGWFPLQELKKGQLLSLHFPNGVSGMFSFKNDRAFIMNPVTGKTGEATIHYDRNNPPMYIRIQMKPGETLVVRVVRERGDPRNGSFQEFESLPDWEYEGEVPEPPGR